MIARYSCNAVPWICPVAIYRSENPECPHCGVPGKQLYPARGGNSEKQHGENVERLGDWFWPLRPGLRDDG